MRYSVKYPAGANTRDAVAELTDGQVKLFKQFYPKVEITPMEVVTFTQLAFDVDHASNLPVIKKARRGPAGWERNLPNTITPADIKAALGFGPNSQGDQDKVTMEWNFTVDGDLCSIYDYKGARWSSAGPIEAFKKIGLIK